MQVARFIAKNNKNPLKSMGLRCINTDVLIWRRTWDSNVLASLCCLRVTRAEVAFTAILGDFPELRLCPVMLGNDGVLRQFLRQDFFNLLK